MGINIVQSTCHLNIKLQEGETVYETANVLLMIKSNWMFSNNKISVVLLSLDKGNRVNKPREMVLPHVEFLLIH